LGEKLGIRRGSWCRGRRRFGRPDSCACRGTAGEATATGERCVGAAANGREPGSAEFAGAGVAGDATATGGRDAGSATEAGAGEAGGAAGEATSTGERGVGEAASGRDDGSAEIAGAGFEADATWTEGRVAGSAGGAGAGGAGGAAAERDAGEAAAEAMSVIGLRNVVLEVGVKMVVKKVLKLF